MESNDAVHVLTVSQAACMGSASLRGIVELLAGARPMTRMEISAELARSASTVHDQIRKLVAAGLVVEAGSRPSGKRPEKTYQLIAARLSSAQASMSEEGRAALGAAGRRIASSAGRAFEKRVRNSQVLLAGSARQVSLHRLVLRLDDEGLGRLNTLLDRIIDELPEQVSSGAQVSLTIIVN